jgi:hypothetical protein
MNKNILKGKITENQVGDIKIGMSFNDFVKLFLDVDLFNFGLIRINAVFPATVIYTFYNSIDCFFDMKSSILVRVDVYNKFSGHYLNNIKIGNKLECLKKNQIELVYDDDNVMLSNSSDWSISAVVDEDLTILDSIEDKYNTKIEKITLLHQYWYD